MTVHVPARVWCASAFHDLHPTASQEWLEAVPPPCARATLDLAFGLSHGLLCLARP